MHSSVIVRGTGLSCALGDGTDACVARLRAGQVVPRILDIAGLEERIRMPFYAMPGTQDLFDPTRAASLLPRVAHEAVTAAGLAQEEIDRLPVFIGTSAFSIRRSEIQPAVPSEVRDAALALPLLGYEQIAGTLQRTIGKRGDVFGFNTACTSAANALMTAARMIKLGWYEHALVVGVEVASLPTLAGFSGLQLLADTLRPFDLRRNGIVLGEGIGAVVLSAAGADASGIHLIAGASNLDSYRVTTAHPDGRSIAALQETALAQAGVDRRDIRGIKAHGTASPMNDTSEAAGIRRVFSEIPPICALKPYIGHTLGACGVNEFVLMTSALMAGFFPATAGFETPDPSLMIAPARETTAAHPGCYMLNYFGFGGHNTALLIGKRA
ncbi:MAG: beta-ketoacyl synthase N-terminal-like domain-containing protein [Gemmatimonadaceae bacterium]